MFIQTAPTSAIGQLPSMTSPAGPAQMPFSQASSGLSGLSIQPQLSAAAPGPPTQTLFGQAGSALRGLQTSPAAQQAPGGPAQAYPTLPPAPGQGAYTQPPVPSQGSWGQLPSMNLVMPPGIQGSPWQMQPQPQGQLPSWDNSPAGMGPQIDPQQAYLAAGTMPLNRPQPAPTPAQGDNQWAAVSGLGGTVDNVWTGPANQRPRYDPTGSPARTFRQHRWDMLDAAGMGDY